jgi:NAD+ synthase (glutamine-hydrolysing)
MYNVNASVPKTLVKFLVEYVAESCDRNSRLYEILIDIAGTTISPELLPPSSTGEIEQSTEDFLGPYELHDFYLSNFVRYGFSPEKILYLSEFADFQKSYSMEVRRSTLEMFIRRFFTQQFKRNCVPDSPKVGSVSLSPRGDWRMPSDSDSFIWLEDLQKGLMKDTH